MAPQQADAKSPVVVEWVWPAAPAAKAGLTAGMTIESIAVDDAADVVTIESPIALAALGGIEVGQPVVLSVATAAGERSQGRLETMAMPADVPADHADTARIARCRGGGQARSPGDRLRSRAVIPAGEKTDPVGVLVYFGPPRADPGDVAAAAWMEAANRYGVAVILPVAADPQRWSLRRHRRRGPQHRFPPQPPRHRCLADRRGGQRGRLRVRLAGSRAPGRPCGAWRCSMPRCRGRRRWSRPNRRPRAGSSSAARRCSRADADRRRLIDAGHAVGTIPPRPVDSIPTETLAAFVETLGVLRQGAAGITSPGVGAKAERLTCDQ